MESNDPNDFIKQYTKLAESLSKQASKLMSEANGIKSMEVEKKPTKIGNDAVSMSLLKNGAILIEFAEFETAKKHYKKSKWA